MFGNSWIRFCHTRWPKSGLDYAASDVLHLHRLQEKLDVMMAREDRTAIFQACLKFLPTRVKLDLLCFGSGDIFSH